MELMKKKQKKRSAMGSAMGAMFHFHVSVSLETYDSVEHHLGWDFFFTSTMRVSVASH